MAGAAFWAVTGTVSSTLSASGVLTHAQGSYVLQSPVAGQVTDVLAEEGERVAADTPLVKVRTSQGSTVVRTLAAGRLTALAATIGSVITPGADVAAVERVAKADDPLMAMLYVPAGSGATVPVGASVDLTVQSVPTQQYGVLPDVDAVYMGAVQAATLQPGPLPRHSGQREDLRGKVASVTRTAQTRQRISGFLGSSQLGEQFSRQGPPVAVLVRLATDPDGGESGFVWSSSQGPPYRLDSMTLAGGSIELAEQHPIEWLLP
ncbi:hypothetical protein [Streptomyces cyaneofuscatus]|uniref:hypothetical protein n=1 Tax=Streptomyces cyaneofuscatus TaxID=66883 RepID=UPI0036536055